MWLHSDSCNLNQNQIGPRYPGICISYCRGFYDQSVSPFLCNLCWWGCSDNARHVSKSIWSVVSIVNFVLWPSVVCSIMKRIFQSIHKRIWLAVKEYQIRLLRLVWSSLDIPKYHYSCKFNGYIEAWLLQFAVEQTTIFSHRLIWRMQRKDRQGPNPAVHLQNCWKEEWNVTEKKRLTVEDVVAIESLRHVVRKWCETSWAKGDTKHGDRRW